MLRKLLMIVFGISLVLAAGSCNIYPLYLSQMMEKFGYTLKEVNLFGSFINSGLWMAFTMGLFYDKFGPKLSCILGAVFLSGSYALLHMIMNSELKSFSLFPLLIIAFVMGQGSALCYTTAITSNLRNFYSNNSAIVGLLVSNMAISPSIFTTYRQALSQVRIANYFLMISVFLAIVILSCGWVFTNIKNLYSDHEKLKEYEKYKEKNIIKLLVLVNVLILVVYTFGVIFNNVFSDENKFPNAIVYPCLQMLNFLFIIFEKFGIWEKIYFKEFIDKQVRLRLKLEETNGENSQPIPNQQENRGSPDKNSPNNFKSENIPQENIEKENPSHPEKVEIKSSNSQSYKNKRRSSFDYKSDYKYSNAVLSERPVQQHLNKTISDNIYFSPSLQNSIFFPDNKILDQPNYRSEQENKNQSNIESVIKNNSFPIINNQITNLDNQENKSELKIFLKIVIQNEIIILFIILVLGIGSLIANLNNIQFIISSISASASSKEIFDYAILYFVFNSFFRIFSGVIIDKLISQKKTFYFLIVISSIGFISQLCGISMDKDWLFISMAMAGVTHGGYMTFTPIYSRRFGIKNMGKVLGLLTTGCAIGSLVIADFIFLIFYDKFETDGKCVGQKCFSGSYIITSVCFFINIILSVILTLLDKKNSVNLSDRQ